MSLKDKIKNKLANLELIILFKLARFVYNHSKYVRKRARENNDWFDKLMEFQYKNRKKFKSIKLSCD